MTDKTRAEFESFVSSQGLSTAIYNDLYRSQIVGIMWKTWQAAKEKYEPSGGSVEDRLPEIDQYVVWSCEDGYMNLQSEIKTTRLVIGKRDSLTGPLSRQRAPKEVESEHNDR